MASQSERLSIKDTFAEKLIGKAGEVNVETIADTCFLGLYFSAHWCPPCKSFTPVLKELYEKLKAQNAKLEIIFVSLDRDAEAFEGYFKEMPWIALKYEERTTQKELVERYGITGIPTLVILNQNGGLITKDGRDDVVESKGDGIPWAL